MIANDYIGGYWDSTLRLMEYAVNQNVMEAILNIALNRREIAEDKNSR